MPRLYRCIFFAGLFYLSATYLGPDYTIWEVVYFHLLGVCATFFINSVYAFEVTLIQLTRQPETAEKPENPPSKP